MAYNRFPVEQYATLELNQVAFPKTGMVVSQVPLGAKFVEGGSGNYGVCENGMWVVADKAAGAINAPAAVDAKPIGIVYTTEKEYDIFHYGLKTFGRKIAGDYPRVGVLGIGDTVTTNCLQYSTAVFADDAALDTYLKGDLTSAPAYVIIDVTNSNGNTAIPGVPAIVKALPQNYAGAYGRIVKYYTVPNGEKGVKYQMIRV